MKRLIHFIRVSDLGDRDPESVRTQSMDQQRDGAKAICHLSDATIAHEVVALNVSGGKNWPSRELASVIALVDSGEYDGIVVYDLARFGRHLDALKVIERWATEGKVFLSASDKFDATTASGRMCLRMMMVVATYYWEAVRDRFADSQDKAYKRGAHIGRTPFGYQRITDDADPKAGCLVVDPETGPIVTEAFRIAAADGLHAAMAYLNERVPQRRWSTDDVRQMMSRRTYLGEVSLGAQRKRAHDPLTTLHTWTVAQTEPSARVSDGDYVLSKIATCETCGEGLTGQRARHHRTKLRYRRYRCSNPSCNGGSSINADALEAHVRAFFASFLDQWEFRVRFEVAGLQEATDALTQARDDAARFARNTALLRSMTDADAAAMAEGLAAEVDAAMKRYEQVAKLATRSEQMPSADQLRDDEHLLRALRLIEPRIVVKRGRRGGHASTHPPVSARVVITDEDGLDYGAGVAAA
jgi:DNA invertase Pin-like site-specific DNA recombinase